MSSFVPVLNVHDLPWNSVQRVDLAGRSIAIYNLRGEFYATDDQCTHAKASLSEGDISGDEIVCPLHFASYNIKTGQCACGPAFDDLRIYAVRVNGGLIEIAMSPGD